MTPARALTIAGSDSVGCAGIQADLRTFAALGVHGASVITSVTAQDTSRVHMISHLPLEMIERQMEAVVEDIGVDAVKTGMLSSSAIVSLVAGKLRQYHLHRLVVDPVMAATGGDPLLQIGAVEALKNELFPLALIVTPNLREAEILTGCVLKSEQSVRDAAHRIVQFGPQSVIIKGGHLADAQCSTDYFYDGHNFLPLPAPRIPTGNTRGSGCTFASAIAALLARNFSLERAVVEAKDYVTEAIRHSYSLGRGHGPLGHFYRLWEIDGSRDSGDGATDE